MKRVIAIILALLLMIPTGITAMAANKVITSVNLPVSETDFWTDAAIENPVFYSSLECMINNQKVTVDGFAWECSDYKADSAGTYVFSAVAPDGYVFDCESPKITVNMKSGDTYHHSSYYMSRDYMGQNITVKGVNDTYNRFYDRTGLYELRPGEGDTGNALSIIAGIDYNKTATVEANANIALENANLTHFFAGSYGTNYIGTSTVYVDGGVISNGLYAGSANGTFNGTTNIYLSGSPSINLLSCGGYFEVDARTSSKGSIVGSTTVSYDGTVNIYIAEDFNGEIINIELADADQVNFYISSGAQFNISRYQIAKSNVNVYIDGVLRDIVTQVDYDGSDFVIGALGTVENNVLKGGITAFVNGSKVEFSNIVWESADYSASTEGVYTFTPVLPDTCYLADGVELPEVNVLVAGKGQAKIQTVSYKNETVIPDGINLNELHMPDTVTAEFILNNTTYTYDIPATFTSQNYSSNAGTYTFDLSLDCVFSASSLPSMQVKVSEDAVVSKSGDVYEIISTGVRFSGEKRKNYKITDIAGIYTYYDNVDIINTVYAKGNGVELAIDSDVVYIQNKIDLNDTSGNVILDIPVALVTRVRYDSDIANRVYINGVQMSEHTTTTVSVNSSKIYANGIPSIVAAGDDGGTYIYRANDMSILYSGDITDYTVYGGGKSGTNIVSTNVAFMSGYLRILYGGGEGNVNDATLVLDGGNVGYMRAGGTSDTTTLHTTVILESGEHRKQLIMGGMSGSVVGDSSKTYADDEFAAQLHLFGGSYLHIYLGASGEIYGNVQMLQYGGKVQEFNASTTGKIYGNIDITVYEGVWEYTYDTTSLTGTSTLRLYKDLMRHDYKVFPNINGDNINITYFDGGENFDYIQYTHNKDKAVSSDEDEGKLVIRFLETKYYGEEKYKQRYFKGYGDCMYITFPNGQNMLVDTGGFDSHELTISTLKEIGVTELDYMLITHMHADHMGAIIKIAEEFPIKTFIIQDQISISTGVQSAIDENGSELLRANRYDSMMIGDVELYALNPTEPMQDEANVASMATLLTFGESKALLGADTYVETELDWLSDNTIKTKIKDCSLIKLGHHGYATSSNFKYINHVNADKVVITSTKEYGGCLDGMMHQLTTVHGYNRNDISVTGMNGLIKVTLDGTRHGTTVEQEYARIEPYYADYTEIESVIEQYNSYDGALSQEDIEKWEEALSLVEYNLYLEEQAIVDGVSEHLRNVFNDICPTVDSVIISGDAELKVGDTIELTATVFPVNAEYDDIIWSTEDLDIVELGATTGDKITVTGLTEGTAEITVTVGVKTVTYTVTVKAAEYVVEVNLTEGCDYVLGVGSLGEEGYLPAMKLVLVYTNAEGMTFDYDGVQMFDVTGADYKYNGNTAFEQTENTKVYALVVKTIADGSVDDYKAKVTRDTEAATVIDYTNDNDVNFVYGVERTDITAIYSVADHDESIIADKYMMQIIKADINRDKKIDINDATSVIADVYGD